jgi:hypothetical protein
LNKKNRSCQRNLLLICFILLVSSFLIGFSTADNDLVYNKNSTPVFTLKGESLIFSMKGSYDLQNTTLSGDISDFQDENIKLDYLLFGHNVVPGVFIGPFCTVNQITNQIDPDCASREANASEWHELRYETEMEGLDSYLNSPSLQQDFSVNYEILNQNVTKISPFIFNLGTWPTNVNEKSIDELLNKKTQANRLIIYGSDKALILSKDDTDFIYLFTKEKENYVLSIENVNPNIGKKRLSLFFRPVSVQYEINISDLFPKDMRESKSFKPQFKINISNKNIQQLNFTYNEKTTPHKIATDGYITFDDWVEPIGDVHWYPIDSYKSEILVYPPLLINDTKNLDMPLNSGFNGEMEIQNNKITILLFRSQPIIWYQFAVIFFSSLILILSLLLKPKEFLHMTIAFIVFLATNTYIIITFFLNHLFSVGSVISFIVVILGILLYFKLAIFGTKWGNLPS